MREHIEVGLGIVVQHAPAGRHIVAEGFGDEGRIGQQPPEPLGHLRQRIRQRLGLEDRATFGAEFIERVSHGRLRPDLLFHIRVANMRIRRRVDARASPALISGSNPGRFPPGNATATMGQKTRE